MEYFIEIVLKCFGVGQKAHAHIVSAWVIRLDETNFIRRGTINFYIMSFATYGPKALKLPINLKIGHIFQFGFRVYAIS